MVHLKRTTHTITRTGRVIYRVLIPRVHYYDAPRDLRRAARHAITSQPEVNDRLDAQSEEERGREANELACEPDRDMSQRVTRASEQDGDWESEGPQGEGEAEEEGKEDGDEGEGDGRGPVVTYEESESLAFMERMREYVSSYVGREAVSRRGVLGSGLMRGRGRGGGEEFGETAGIKGVEMEGGRTESGRERKRSISPPWPEKTPIVGRGRARAAGSGRGSARKRTISPPGPDETPTEGRGRARASQNGRGRGGRGRGRSVSPEPDVVPRGRAKPAEGVGNVRERGRGRTVVRSASPEEMAMARGMRGRGRSARGMRGGGGGRRRSASPVDSAAAARGRARGGQLARRAGARGGRGRSGGKGMVELGSEVDEDDESKP